MAIIGIDIDGTLAGFGEWKGGEHIAAPNPEMEHVVRQLNKRGHSLYAWTTRPDYIVRAWLQEHKLLPLFDGINCSPYPTESGKASFDFYIGDDAVRWTGDNTDDILRLIGVPGFDDGRKFEREVAFSDQNPKLYLQGVGRAYVDQFEQEWRDAWDRHHFGKPVAFLTICSHAKPYSKSFIHGSIRKRLHSEGVLHLCDYIHISNAGIIPSDAEEGHPFCAYDWNGEHCTEEVREYHKAALRRRLAEWFELYRRNYVDVIVYLRGGGNTHGCVEDVMEAQGLTFPLVGARNAPEDRAPFVLSPDPDDCLTSDFNLNLLMKSFEGLTSYKPEWP